MKKFLILYFIFVFSLSTLYLTLRLKEAGAQEQKTVVRKNHKNVVIIITDKFEPMGRVICQTPKGTMIYNWKSVKDAILEMEEVKERYRKCEGGYELFIQYDRYPH